MQNLNSQNDSNKKNNMNIDYDSNIIKNTLKEFGYEIKVSFRDDNFKEEPYYSVQLFNTYGIGFGNYKIDYCAGCFNETDVALWIRDNFKEKYPEMFR